MYSEYAYPTVTSKFGEGGAENHYYTSADATGAKKLPPKLPKGGVAAKGAASEGKGFSRHYSMESSSASPELYEYLGPEYGDPVAMEHEVESIYSDPVVGRIEVRSADELGKPGEGVCCPMNLLFQTRSQEITSSSVSVH